MSAHCCSRASNSRSDFDVAAPYMVFDPIALLKMDDLKTREAKAKEREAKRAIEDGVDSPTPMKAMKGGAMKAMKIAKGKAKARAKAKGGSMKAMKAMKAMKGMKAMKAMKGGKAMTKSGILDAISTPTGLKRKEVQGVLESLCEVVTSQVKKSGKFVIPGIAMLKLKHKPARKACTKLMFGEMQKVKAKPACKVVKAFAAKALKDACK